MPAVKGSFRFLIFLAVLIVGLVIGSFATRSSAQSQTQQEFSLVRVEDYDYAAGQVGKTFIERLNTQASMGWRVAGILPSVDHVENDDYRSYVLMVRDVNPSGDSGNNGSSGLLGDLDNDGDVDFSDFLVLVENFGKTVSG